MSKKGKADEAKAMASVHKTTTRKPKGDANTKGATSVRPSTQAVRSGADQGNGSTGKSVDNSDTSVAVERAKATAAAARAGEQAAIQQLGSSNRLGVGDWIAVTLFILALLAAGYVLGRIAG